MVNVYKRTVEESKGKKISSNIFNLIFGITLLWGFVINWLVVQYVPLDVFNELSLYLVIAGYIMCCFAGFIVFYFSDNPLFSFIGYNLVIFLFGFFINLAVSRHDPYLVSEVIRVIGMVTVLVTISSLLFPCIYKRIESGVVFTLACVVMIQVIEVFLFKIEHYISDWIIVYLFCGYMGLNWSRANNIPTTVDNAVDGAAAHYMGIFILFISYLACIGKNESEIETIESITEQTH